MELTCEQLGITKEEIADKVAAKIASAMLAQEIPDYDDETGEPFNRERPTAFSEMIRKRVARKIEQAVDAIAEKHVGSELAGRLEELRFPMTNHYGEKKGEPLTLLEFIEKRVGTYLTEKVDYQGRTDSYSSSNKDRTRVVWMLEQFLAERMKEHFSKALATANQQITDGIAQTMKDKLAEVAAKLKAKVEVG